VEEIMKHHIQIQEKFALIHVSGTAGPSGFSATAVALLALPEWKPNMNILIDYSDLNLSNVTTRDVDILAQSLAPHREQMGGGFCAIVNTKPLDFGLGRIWQVYMEEYTDLRVAVFYDIDEAKSWLQSRN
jgi:hypothetical protein